MITEESVRSTLNDFGYDYADLDFRHVSRLSNVKSSGPDQFVVLAYSEPNKVLECYGQNISFYASETSMSRYKVDHLYVHGLHPDYEEYASFAIHEDLRTIHCFHGNDRQFKTLIEKYLVNKLDKDHARRVFATRVLNKRYESMDDNLRRLYIESQRLERESRKKQREGHSVSYFKSAIDSDLDLSKYTAVFDLPEPMPTDFLPSVDECFDEAVSLAGRVRRTLREYEELKLEKDNRLTVDDILAQINQLSEFSVVEKIEFDESSVLNVYTNDIIVSDNEERYNVGQVLIRIKLDGGRPTFHRYKSTMETRIHPHINNNNDGCWGNIGRPLDKAIREYDVIGIFDCCMFLLEHINPGDTYFEISRVLDPV